MPHLSSPGKRVKTSGEVAKVVHLKRPEASAEGGDGASRAGRVFHKLLV